jgi:hypothetical protein
MHSSLKSVELYEKEGALGMKSSLRTAMKYVSPGFRNVKACSIGQQP